jgi:PilZ domain
MTDTDLRAVADAVVRRAQRQGFVVAREIREELTQAGLADSRWKSVVTLTRPALTYRNARYYYTAPMIGDRLRQEQSQQARIQQAIRQFIEGHHAAAAKVERRQQDRIDLLQSVKVQSEDGRERTLLCRDLSTTGIRLLGSRGLLGQKVRVLLPRDGAEPWSFVVRILWTCAIGDELFESGGTFLQLMNADG